MDGVILMETTCPQFECIDFQIAECENHYACEGCNRFCSCNVCAHQSILIGDSIIPCDLINLPIPCRSCATRNNLGFEPSVDCFNCDTISDGK